MTASAAEAAGPGRRLLFLVPVRDYADADQDYLTGIDHQVETIQTWWGDEDRLDDRVFTLIQPRALRRRRDLENFLHDSGLRDAEPADVVVVYVTGHGKRGTSGTHYLLMPDGDPTHSPRHAFPTAEVVMAALHSDARHVLVIVNACFADAIRGQLVSLFEDLPPQRRDMTSLAVLTTADFDERPRVREFSTLLRRTHDRLLTTAEFVGHDLSLEDFLAELRAAGADSHSPLREPSMILPKRRAPDPTPCLPNPGYRPPDDVVGPARRQVAASSTEIDYWLDRASGRTDAADPGWYFSGRATLTEQVARFLREGHGVLIVTGTAGSGKSAIIARAVTLSDAQFAEDPRYRIAIGAEPETAAGPEPAAEPSAGQAATVPPVGSIDVAVLARNKDQADLLTILLTGLGAAPGRPPAGADQVEHLRDLLTERITTLSAQAGRQITVVLDGLDEATDPARTIPDVIAPLARMMDAAGKPIVRLLIGVRSPQPPDAAGHSSAAAPVPGGDHGVLLDLLWRTTADRAPQLIRTDGPGTEDDVAAYVQALLARGRGHDLDAATRPRVIAGKVSPSFLDARLAATRLADDPDPPAIDDPAWLASLDQGTVGQLRLDLRDVAVELATPDDRMAAGQALSRLTAVLRASAYALGAGVPRADIWPALATAVLGAPIPDVDDLITTVLTGRLAGYLARDVADRRVVYRPVHERLGEVLRAGTDLLDPPSAQPAAGSPP